MIDEDTGKPADETDEAATDESMADEAVTDETVTDAAEEAEAAETDPEAQIAELNDRLLRTLAELENTRRRAERDRGEALKYGAVSFARDMVGVVDNLQRALKAVDLLDAAARDALPETVSGVLEGVAATERDLLAALARHKVSPVEPMGEKFDPNLHEALFEAPGTGQPAGTVIEVVECGYRMDERLLRPAKVGIAKD